MIDEPDVDESPTTSVSKKASINANDAHQHIIDEQRGGEHNVGKANSAAMTSGLLLGVPGSTIPSYIHPHTLARLHGSLN